MSILPDFQVHASADPFIYPGKMQSKTVAKHDLGSVMVADAVGA